jgi:hypothetical protein
MGHRIDSSRTHWAEKTATGLEDDLSVLVSMLMKESLELGQIGRTSKDYSARRARVAELWRRFGPSVSQLRAKSEREARRATRDALHARLCEIGRNADRRLGQTDKPYIAWKMAIDEVIDWLDSWAK